MIPGSEWHYFLSIIDALKTEKHKPSKKTEKLIQEFLERCGSNKNYQKVKLRHLFQEIEGETNDRKRE